MAALKTYYEKCAPADLCSVSIYNDIIYFEKQFVTGGKYCDTEWAFRDNNCEDGRSIGLDRDRVRGDAIGNQTIQVKRRRYAPS